MDDAKRDLPKGGSKRMRLLHRFTASPAVNVLIWCLVFICIFIGCRLIYSPDGVAQLKFYEQAGRVDVGGEPGQLVAPASYIFSGEVYDTAVRLRETAALGMAVSLAVFNESAETRNVPATPAAVWMAINKRGFMPPGLVLDGSSLSSETSEFAFRYKQRPLQFELVAMPRNTAQGPAIMFRFPLPVTNGKTISYFRSSIVRRNEMPPPFMPVEELSSLGWSIETWRVELLPQSEQILKTLSEEKNAWGGQR